MDPHDAASPRTVPDPDGPRPDAGRVALDDLLQRLQAHWVMTLATLAPREDGGDRFAPYTTPLFYAATPAANGIALVFATDPATAHGRHLEANPEAAGAVYLETEELGRIEGVQMRGTVRPVQSADRSLRDAYLTRHPVAADMLERGPARLFAFEIHWAKVTDNALGYGVHPTWTAAGSTP